MNMETEQKFQVMLVEDHPMFREQLAQLINKEPGMTVCGEADNVHDAFQLIESNQPDIAIVDLSLKGSSGLELIKNLKAKENDVPVLVLSMHDEALYAERAMRAGASGYITKNQEAPQILEAVKTVLAGKIYLSVEMTSSLLKGFTATGSRNASNPIERLSDRELQILSLIGRGRSTRDIAKLLNLGIATVDTYRARIKDKMNFRNATDLLHFAIRWVSERE